VNVAREPKAGRSLQHRPVKLAVLDPLPIHDRAPLYRRIARDPRVDFTVIFATSVGARPGELGYHTAIRWDVDLLSGYRSIFLSRADHNEIGGFFSLTDPDVIRLLVAEHFDVLCLFGYNFLTYLMAALCQKARRKPLLYWEDQTLLHPRAPLKAAIKLIALRALFRNTRALYVGSQNRRWFEHYGVPKDRLFFTPHSVDNEALQSSARRLAPKGELRKAFGISPDAGPVILTVARMIPKKQPLFLVEAFRRTRQKRRCVLLIVGSGELEHEVQIAAADIADVRFAGFLNRSRISEAYGAADIFVLPSKYNETWGLAVNEAMNFGLPIVVSDKVGSASDLVVSGENGYVVSADDPGELALRLGSLADSAELRERFGLASARIIRNWSPDKTAAGVLKAVAASVGPERWQLIGPAT
jgi:glycosyltransferase involved in cell wall biosynthesis